MAVVSSSATRAFTAAEIAHLDAGADFGGSHASAGNDYAAAFNGGTVSEFGAVGFDKVGRAMVLPDLPGCSAGTVELSLSATVDTTNTAAVQTLFIGNLDDPFGALVFFDGIGGPQDLNVTTTLSLDDYRSGRRYVAVISAVTPAEPPTLWSNMAFTVAYDDSRCQTPPRPSCEPYVPADDPSLVSCPEWLELSLSEREAIAMAASQLLWIRSGRQIGVCTSTVWPCLEDIPCGGCQRFTSGDFVPGILGQGTIDVAGMASCIDHSCGCVPLRELGMAGPYPVISIEAVTLNGAVVPASAYRLDDWRLLVMLDGAAWPTCNDLSTPDAGMSVTVRWGNKPDELDKMAARALMIELAKQRVCPEKCALPPGVRSITGYGNTLEIDAGSLERLAGGWELFGLPVLAAWLHARNPKDATGTAFVFRRNRSQRYVGV